MTKRISKHKTTYLEEYGFVFIKNVLNDNSVYKLYEYINKYTAITYLKYYPQNNGVHIYNVFSNDKKEVTRFLGIVKTTKQLKLLFEILDLENNNLI